jgi:hypothetical protein
MRAVVFVLFTLYDLSELSGRLERRRGVEQMCDSGKIKKQDLTSLLLQENE